MSVTSKTANADKGGRYVSLLDQALCNGNWNDITELARKAEKHSPERKCTSTALPHSPRPPPPPPPPD